MTSPHCKKCYSARLRFPTLEVVEAACLGTEEVPLEEDVFESDVVVVELCVYDGTVV